MEDWDGYFSRLLLAVFSLSLSRLLLYSFFYSFRGLAFHLNHPWIIYVQSILTYLVSLYHGRQALCSPLSTVKVHDSHASLILGTPGSVCEGDRGPSVAMSRECV